MKVLTDEKKNQIMEMILNGHSTRFIESELKCSRTIVTQLRKEITRKQEIKNQYAGLKQIREINKIKEESMKRAYFLLKSGGSNIPDKKFFEKIIEKDTSDLCIKFKFEGIQDNVFIFDLGLEARVIIEHYRQIKMIPGEEYWLWLNFGDFHYNVVTYELIGKNIELEVEDNFAF